MEGLIIKGIGGAYYVKSEGKIYVCKARGVFRKDGITPLAGDIVNIGIEKDDEGVINEIKKRKNSLIRPPVANIDKLFIITSIKDPIPNRLIIASNKCLADPCFATNRKERSCGRICRHLAFTSKKGTAGGNFRS